MNMVLQIVLAVVLLTSAAVEAETDKVTISGNNVTMTCPGEGEWFKGGKKQDGNEAKYKYVYSGGKDLYHCQYDDTNGDPATTNYYYFYIQGKTCEKCFELDALVFAGVIAADVFLTIFFMAMIYSCSKKAASRGPQHGSNASHSREVNIPLTSPDYAPLNTRTVAQDPYSSIHRTG